MNGVLTTIAMKGPPTSSSAGRSCEPIRARRRQLSGSRGELAQASLCERSRGAEERRRWLQEVAYLDELDGVDT
jgi:hypothetical protein